MHILISYLISLDVGVKCESNISFSTTLTSNNTADITFLCLSLAYHHKPSHKNYNKPPKSVFGFQSCGCLWQLDELLPHSDAYRARWCFLNTVRCWLALPLWWRLSIGCQRRGWLLLITNVVTGYDQGPRWHSLCKGQCMAKPTMKKWAFCHHCQGKRSDTSWLVIELSN